MPAPVHYASTKRRISPASLDMLVILAVALAIYLAELVFSPGELLLNNFDAISVFGLQGDEFLLMFSFMGFVLLVYSMRRQRETKLSERALQQSEKRFRAL